jgi:PAS domain S-box-containing protein
MQKRADQNEIDRLLALKSYDILDTLAEEEYDELTVLAAEICQTPISLISLVDDKRQWFKSVHGIEVRETPIEESFCAHAIQQPLETMVVRDARTDERFCENPHVKGNMKIVFYAGVPLVDTNQCALGTLCVIDHVPRELTKTQLKSLQVLAKSTVRLLELRKNNRNLNVQLDLVTDALSLNNPFYLILQDNLTIEQIGSNFQKVLPELSINDAFSDHFSFAGSFSIEDFMHSEETSYNRLLFLQCHNRHQKYKCSVKKVSNRIVLAASPIINSEFKLTDYGLRINDFAQHDYIAEYLFLQQTTDRSLKDSRQLTEKLVKRNEELTQMQRDILSLSRFPDENPNPVLRLTLDFSIAYCNAAAKATFNPAFGITENTIEDSELKQLLSKLIEHNQSELNIILERNQAHYSISAKYVQELNYINLYVKDISEFVHGVNQAMSQMNALNAKVEEQRRFYEFILNNIPADIAVFSNDHKYVFVNPLGIQNPEVREFIIGKDDFDYCKYRGIPDTMAHNRRKLFRKIQETKEFANWEDDMVNAQGERRVVYRRMGPIFNEAGEIEFIIGYGVTITDRKLAEEKLLEANKRMALLENFLNRSSDAIQVADESGQMIYINQTASKRLGIPSERITDYNVRDFEKSMTDEAAWEKHVEEVKQKGLLQLEGQNLNQQSGELIDVEVNLKYENIDDNGYIIATSRDISERKRTEAEIRKLSLVAKNTNNGIVMLDVNRLITWANESMVKRSGYVLSELIGKSPKKFQFEGTDEATTSRIYNQMLQLQTVNEEVEHLSKNGRRYWVDLNIQPLFDQNGNHTGYMAVEFDISERKAFELTIAEHNKNLQEITDALDQSSLVSIADSQGRIIKVNEIFCKTSKFAAEELIGQPHSIINSGYHSKEFWRDVWKKISSGKIWNGEVCNKAKDGSIYWVDSVIYPIRNMEGNIDKYLSIRHDITARKLLEEKEKEKNKKIQEINLELEKIIQAEKTVNLLAESFLNGSDYQTICWDIVENVIAQLDFQDCIIYRRNGNTLVQVAAIGEKKGKDRTLLNPLQVKVGKGIVGTVAETGKYLLIEDTSKDERYIIDDLHRLSEVAVPIKVGNEVWGVIDSEHPEKGFFTHLHLRVLMTISNMLAQKITALSEQQQKEKLQTEILEINEQLEQRVVEEISRNLELTKSITDQEKLVTLGEISSGIAHDLNTPLGAIKSGAESIQFTLNQLLKESISNCSKKQIDVAYARAEHKETELFVGGLQQIRETKMFIALLNEQYPDLQETETRELAALFVKARVTIDETAFIEEVIQSKNAMDYLKVVFHVKMMYTFLDTILKSSDKAARVVQDLRSFIKEQKNSGKTTIDLRKNIETVLNIFNFELKRVANVEFDVAEGLQIEGFDIKMFQLWSNLIKNAIEAMEEKGERGHLKIYSTQEQNKVSIVVFNDGPQIPLEIQDQIFDKFYTTKASKNGTGLGLNIVKNIIDDHNAKIALKSTDENTQFIVTFTT